MLCEAEIRELFPIVHNKIYLDSGSKCAVPMPVYERLCRFYNECFLEGRQYDAWWDELEQVRQKLARLIGTTGQEIGFFSSTTHAVNVVAQGLGWQTGDNVVVCAQEFPSNLYPWLHLREKGVEVRLLKAKDGHLDPQQYEALMDASTKLVAVSHVQAATGYKSDLTALGQLCKKYNALFFVDATQSCGLFPIDVDAAQIDFLCASAYKWLLGTDGLAFLYGRRQSQRRLEFVYRGWAGRTAPNDYTHHRFDYPDSIRRFELGNHNYSAVCALGTGLDLLDQLGPQQVLGRTTECVAWLKDCIKHSACLKLAYDFDSANTGALVVVQTNSDPEPLFRHLASQHITAALKPNGIRLSPYFYNTKEEVAHAVQVMDAYCRQNGF